MNERFSAMQGDVEVRRDPRVMGLSVAPEHSGEAILASDPCMIDAGEAKTRVELFLITWIDRKESWSETYKPQESPLLLFSSKVLLFNCQ
jgi:hypothetical protein